jgi:AcrR family transcriptional regulator
MIQKNSSQRIERKREQRLQSLLQAAFELVMEEGLAGLTMQKLADRQDSAVGGLYRYFKSKDALLAALQRQVLSDFASVIQAADLCFLQQAKIQTNLSERSEVLARLLLASEVYFHLPKICPQRFRLLYEMSISPEPLLGLQEGFQVLQVALPLFKHLESRFDHAARIQALKSGAASQRAILYWSSLQGLLPLEKLTRFVPLYDLPKLRVELENTLLLGMGAHSEDLKQARINLKTFVVQSEYLYLFESLLERKLP